VTDYVNPVLSGMFPDPSVCRVGDTFYLANSSFEYFPALPLHSSTDLVGWTPIGHAIDRGDQLDLSSVADSGGLFAPTIRHHDGVFYLVCTLVTGSRERSFLITATDPAGAWSDPVWIDEARGIDPTLFFHDGRVWWAGCRVARPGAWPGQTEIWLRELDLESGTLVGEEFILWNGALNGAVWAEGPHLYERGGWFYLVAAEGGTSGDHAVSVARSRSVSGPYEGNPRNPILTHRHLGRDFSVQNVGHADLVEAADGSWWALALGVRSEHGFHLRGRETFLAPVAWEQDWPVINPGVGRLSEASAPGLAGGPISAGVLEDFRDSRTVGGHWLSPRGPATWATPTPEGLTIAQTADDLGSGGRPAFLGYRLQHARAVVSIRFLPPPPGVTAGLALVQSSAFQVRLAVCARADGWTVEAIQRVSGVDHSLGSTALDVPALPAPIELTAEFDALTIRLLASAGAEPQLLAEADARDLSTERAGGFVGVVVGPFATGLPGTSITMTSFEYRPVSAFAANARPAALDIPC
jgi:xylan 1,4-beta-xylosidase